MAHDNKDGIDDLKKELYSRTQIPAVGSDIRTPLSPFENEVPHAWQDVPEKDASVTAPLSQFSDEQKKKGSSFAGKFLIISIVFFVAAAGAAAYLFFGGANFISSQNIDLQIVAPSLVEGGKDTTIQVIIDNHNKTPLTLATLIVDYPDGTRSAVDPTVALQHDTKTIGTVASGAEVKNTLDAIFYGQQGMQQTVNVTLEYSVPGSNAVFQKQSSLNFLVGSSPVSLSVSAPQAAVSGESFPIDITVQTNAATSVPDVMVEAQYPFGFTVSSSTPAADSGGTIWRLGVMQPGDIKIIHIVGSIQGQDGDQRVFRFLAGSDSNPTDVHIAVPFLSIPQTLTVEQPFIQATLTLNGQQGSTVSVAPNSTVQGTVTWKNNLSTAVSNLSLELSLIGAALNKSSVTASNGFYQSSNSTITWDSQQNSALSSIPPGGTGTFQFSFSTQSATGAVNPNVSLNLSLSGTREGQTGVPDSVSSAAAANVLIGSVTAISASALHFTGPFSDGGPMPPVVGKNTAYTVVWSIKNSSNSLANVSVMTTLPPYVQFVAAQPGSNITYDTPSRTVTWNVRDVAAGAGYGASAPQAAFQVALLPSISQVGSSPQLTAQITLTGQDRFTQANVQETADPITTALSGDSGYNPAMGTVVAQ